MSESYSIYIDKLQKDYRETFNKIAAYVNTMNIDDGSREECLSELLDVFLSAQADGKPVDKITGKNLALFSKTFCSDFGFKSMALRIVNILQTYMWYGLFICVIDCLFFFDDLLNGENPNFFTYSHINIPTFFLGCFIGIVSFYLSSHIVRKIMFKIRKISMNILPLTVGIVTLASVFTAFVLLFESLNVGDIYVPTWIMTVILIVCQAVCLVFKRTVLRKEHTKNAEVLDSNEEIIISRIPQEMEVKLRKANAKNLKRNKPLITYEQLLEKEEKENKRFLKSKAFFILLPIIVTAAGFAITLLTGGFESVFDAVIFCAIILALCYIIVGVLWKFSKRQAQLYLKWINEHKSGGERRAAERQKYH